MGNTSSSNTGGWGNSYLNTMLNARLYNALPTQIQAIVKRVKIPSSIGDKSTEITTSDCYIAVPSCIEVDPTMTAEPYINEGFPVSYLTDNNSRKRAYVDGDADYYWLRSPSAASASYICRVNTDGSVYSYTLPSYSAAILIEISF